MKNSMKRIMNIIKNIFLILGLISIVGTTDAMHPTNSKKIAGKKAKPFRAPKIKNQAWTEKSKLAAQVKHAKQVKKDDDKFPVMPESKKPAQVAPQAEQAEPTGEQIKRDKEERAKLDIEVRKLQEQKLKFMELCKREFIEDEKAHELAHLFYIRHRWNHLDWHILMEAFRNPDVKNPKMLLMLFRTIASELRVLNLAGDAHPHQLFALHIRDFGRLLQEKFIQAVRWDNHGDNIDLVHFLLLELKSDAKQTGSLIYPETIQKSGIYEWVYQTFDNQGASTKLEAILTYVQAVMPANNAEEQEILAQDEETLTQALQNLCLFVAKE